MTARDNTTETTRRTVLRTIGGTSGAIATTGLTAQATATENDDEQVPLVMTYGKDGKPDETKLVPKEYRRRLMVFKRLSRTYFTDKSVVNKISITPRSSDVTDIALEFYIDHNAPSEQMEKLPEQINGVPVIFEEGEFERRPKCDPESASCGCSPVTDSCSDPDNEECRKGQTESDIKANLQVIDEDSFGASTLGVVARDKDTALKMLLTANHAENGDYLYQPDSTSSSNKIGGRVNQWPNQDISKYIWEPNDSNRTATVGGTHASNQSAISGEWSFEGLADRLNVQDYHLSVSVAGKETCYCETEAVQVSRDKRVDKQVEMQNIITESGDSGAPFVDSDGKLVCTLYGTNCRQYSPLYRDVGPAEVLKTSDCYVL